MYFLPYFGCVLLGVPSLRGGLPEGNRIFLLDPPSPPSPPHNQALFLEWGVGGGTRKMSKKMTPSFFGSKIMNPLGFFFYFEPKKCSRAPTPWDLYGAEGDER